MSLDSEGIVLCLESCTPEGIGPVLAMISSEFCSLFPLLCWSKVLTGILLQVCSSLFLSLDEIDEPTINAIMNCMSIGPDLLSIPFVFLDYNHSA